MPFSAEARTTSGAWERVDITLLDAPKIELMNRELRCPDADCHAPLVVRHGAIIAAHFAHKPGAATPGCAFGVGGESQDHLTAKRVVIEMVRSNPRYAGATIEPERILRNGALKRVADVFVTFPDGRTEAHEAQLSRISVEEAQARTEDYQQQLGVDGVIWWLGKANRGDNNLELWATRTCGVFGRLDFILQSIFAPA